MALMKRVKLLLLNIFIVLIVTYLFSWLEYNERLIKKKNENEKTELMISGWFNRQYFLLSEVIPKYRENFTEESEFLLNAVKFTGLQYLVYFDGEASYSNYNHLNSKENPKYVIKERVWFNTDRTISSPFVGRYSNTDNVAIIYRGGSDTYISIFELRELISFINQENVYGLELDIVLTNGDNNILYGNDSYKIGSQFKKNKDYHAEKIDIYSTSDSINVFFLKVEISYFQYILKHLGLILTSFFILFLVSLFSLLKWERFYNKYYNDALTGCRNRHFLLKYFNDFKGFLILIDLDNFKLINDGEGHRAGDDVLVQFVVFLNVSFPDSHIIRYGGDEFLIISSKQYTDVDFNDKFFSFKELSFSYSQQAILSDIFETIHLADDYMYKQKKKKKE
ncbi:GGDEF domain-containing protein [Aliivibrio salmonicida]|uniref:GGDEF domain-containing protein n=1 Tax=Aliivibrio salmonicida TaxID=40269 RepID=UPI00406C9F4C